MAIEVGDMNPYVSVVICLIWSQGRGADWSSNLLGIREQITDGFHAKPR